MHYFNKPLAENPEKVMRLVKAGFSNPRKKLRSSLAAGLNLSVEQAEALLMKATINPDRRAQTVTIEEWIRLSTA